MFFFTFLFGYISSTNTFEKKLTTEEETYYLNEFANGSNDAKNILIERNLRLVAHIAKKYSNFNYDNEDLISIGTIGLIKGVLTFKVDKNIKLGTYCARCIEKTIVTQRQTKMRFH